MGQSVLVCVDDPQVLGSSTCTSEVWVDSLTLEVDSGTDLTLAEAGELASAGVFILAVAFGFRMVRKLMQR